MLRRTSVYCLCLGVIIIGFLLSRRAPHQGTAPVAVGSPASSDTSASQLPKTPSSSPASLPTPLQPVTPVTLQDISSLSDPAQFNKIYQQLTSELIHELIQLRTTRDQDRVISRITPVAQKFYYLKKAHRSLDDAPPFHLPQNFRPDIEDLEDLWNNNHVLAQAADSVFAHMELLDGEHIPYQLREKVLTQ